MLSFDIAVLDQLDVILKAIGANEGIFAGAWRSVEYQKSSAPILLSNLYELSHFLFVDDDFIQTPRRMLLYPECRLACLFERCRLLDTLLARATASWLRHLAYHSLFRRCLLHVTNGWSITYQLRLFGTEGARSQ